METIEARIKKAVEADREALRALLHDPSEKVVLALLSNASITEDELLVLAKRRDLSGEALGMIAGRKLSHEGYKVRLALVNNPKTPRRSALAQIKYLNLRDMAFLTRNKMLPTELRQASEGTLKEKLVAVPPGMKVTLARMVSEDVIKALLLEDDARITKACFENPAMKESIVIWALNTEKVSASVAAFIAMSPKWSLGGNVRVALLRNRNTPIERAIELVTRMKSKEQRALYNDPSVPVPVKVQLEVELEKKGEPLSPPAEAGRVIGIPEDIT